MPKRRMSLTTHRTVREILKLKVLSEARVIAGHAGLDNRVTWVNIMEVPEVADWLRGGELLLTAAYAIANDPHLKDCLIEHLARKQVAALGFKPSKYLQSMPPEMIAQSNHFNLPLIQLPPDLAYADIMDPILMDIYNHKLYLLQRSQEIHEYFTTIALNEEKIDTIVETLSELVGNPVWVENKLSQALFYACTADGEKGKEYRLAAECPAEIIRKYQEIKTSLPKSIVREPLIQEANREGKISRYIASELSIGTEPYGYIIVEEKRRPFEELDLIAVQHGATLACFELLKQRAVAQATSKIEGDLLEDLLIGRFSAAQMTHRASLLQYDLTQPGAILIIDIDDLQLHPWQMQSEKSIQRMKERLFALTRRYFRWRRLPHLSLQKSDSVIILLQLSGPDPEDELQKTTRQLFQEINSDLQEISVSIGVGRVYREPEQLLKSYQEAQIALHASQNIYGNNRLTFYANLGINRILCEIPSVEAIDAFVEEVLGPLIRYDQGRDKDLLCTLQSYLEMNGHKEATAKKMHIHRSSLLYRLKRIQEILGVNLEDPEVRLNLSLALRIKQMLDLRVS
ncbi:MAG: PucR family transcriptional regulator ligand-binding domain-containing protein [Chloroflexi bacterium]|nr:PucR family transcriptional regulator ligand-binding domain-containing protein [Chloroflexota bacterium]